MNHLNKQKFITYFIISLFFIQFSHSLNNTINLNFGWSQLIGEQPENISTLLKIDNFTTNSYWKNCTNIPYSRNNIKNNILWVKNVIGITNFQNPYLEIDAIDQCFEIYINEKLIYTRGDSDNLLSPGFWHLIKLPSDYKNKTIYIKITSNLKKIGLIGKIIIGDKANLITYLVHKDLFWIILGSLYIITGLFFLIFISFKEKRTLVIGFSLFSVSAGLYTIARTQLKFFLFDYQTFWSFTDLFTLYLIPVGFSLFLLKISNLKNKSPEGIITLIFIINILITIIGSIININFIRIIFFTNLYLILSFGIILIILIFYRRRKGNKSLNFLIGGLSIVLVIAIREALVNLAIIHYNFSIMPFAWTILYITLLLTMFQEFKLMNLKLVKYAKEIKEKNAYLRHVERIESLGLLAGGVAHDFNNQLTPIIGYANILKTVSKLPKKNIDMLNTIISAATRATLLTKQLLAFAKKGHYRTEIVDIHLIIDEVITLLKHSIDKKIKIIIKYNANPSTTIGDSTQLQNALLNLAINARDAMPNGGTLTFKTSNFSNDDNSNKFISEGEFIKIDVIDTGMGIPEKNIKKIYEPFFTTKNNSGTGMGLSAVFGTIKSHQGSIDVKTKIDKGSIFTICLPISYTKTKIKIKTSTPSSLKDIKILLIDDDKDVRIVGCKILNDFKYNTIDYASPRKAIEYYKNNHKNIDLVILDMIMPELSGTETFHQLKKINSNVNILIISGYSIDGDIQNLINSGAKDFIQKPFDPNDLNEKIITILDN